MKENLVQRELMIRYLLNDLSRVEELHIEESYFTNSAFLRELLAARNELISSYVRGTLNKHDALLFEKLLHSSTAMQEKVNCFRAFLQSIDAISEECQNEQRAEPSEPIPDQPAQNASQITLWLSAWLPERLHLAWAAGALAASVGVLFGIWHFDRQGRPLLAVPAQSEAAVKALPSALPSAHSSEGRDLAGGVTESIAKGPGEKPAPAETGATVFSSRSQAAAITKPTPWIKTFFLSAMVLRSETATFDLKIPAGVDLVRLHLEVDQDTPAQYEVVLQDRQAGSRILWQKKGLSARGHTSPLVVCDLPVKQLKNGALLLRLRPQRGTDEVEQKYNLNVILPGPNS